MVSWEEKVEILKFVCLMLGMGKIIVVYLVNWLFKFEVMVIIGVFFFVKICVLFMIFVVLLL